MSSDMICVLVLGSKETSFAVHSQVSKMGFNAFFCKTLDKGWDQSFSSIDFDIVIYDAPYPPEDFKEIKKIRSHSDRKINSLPIIVLSINDHVDTMESSIVAGADHFTQKMKPSRFLYMEIIAVVRMARRMRG